MSQWTKPIHRTIRYGYLRFIRLKGSSAQIARGLALGVFWGMFPLPGLQMAIAILTATVFRGSKIAAAAGTWLSNPITTLPFAALNFHIGQTLLGHEWSDLPTDNLRSLDGILNLGVEVIAAYLLGCLVVGSCAALLSYVIGEPIIAIIQQRNLMRRKRRKYRKSSDFW
jgi:uncharacterized protein (DUF2062 family)